MKKYLVHEFNTNRKELIDLQFASKRMKEILLEPPKPQKKLTKKTEPEKLKAVTKKKTATPVKKKTAKK